jgi:predicted transcriptional regulator
MESATLIPYSVHLRPDIHAKIKIAAGERKASSLVRDAITSYIEGESMYDSGYRAGLLDAIAAIKKNHSANNVAIGGETIAEILVEQLTLKIPTKAKNGNKKTTAR